MPAQNELNDFVTRIRQGESVDFQQTLATIDAGYHFTPTPFSNAGVHNRADENQGSCRVFAFARLHGLNEMETLACFGEHYRKVLDTPNGDSHINIRTFMIHGWSGVSIRGEPLTLKRNPAD